MSPEMCIELGLCPACGESTEDGTCWSIWCPEGLENVEREVMADAPARFFDADGYDLEADL